MNYLKARQRSNDQRWDYTSKNDVHIHPIGYCAGFQEYTEEERKRYMMSDKWYAEYVANKDKYHKDGHATEEEAQACYKRHQLDTEMRVSQSSSAQHKCEVCQTWTQTGVSVGGYRMFTLCDQHANRDEVEKLYSVGEAWES